MSGGLNTVLESFNHECHMPIAHFDHVLLQMVGTDIENSLFEYKVCCKMIQLPYQ